MKITLKTTLLIFSVFWAYSLSAQDEEGQSRESMAVDATASQWSFQFAYQAMPDYHNDILSDGSTRPAGLDDYAQLRVVAPISLEKLTILPRLTIRHYEASSGKSGFGNTELFALIMPKATDWGTGRAGIGPLVTAPGNPDVSKDEWGYGLAGAIVQNTGNWFYGLLLTQSFRSVDPSTLPAGTSDANPLGIAPFVNYRFGTTGLYIQTADIVALYDWNTSEFYLPIGARFGKVWVWEKASLNVYAEYRTSMIYKNWSGSAVKNSYRLNVSYTIPVGI
jgi:heme/copper-type cytochrome/quinol oxidase subunit 2